MRLLVRIHEEINLVDLLGLLINMEVYLKGVLVPMLRWRGGVFVLLAT